MNKKTNLLENLINAEFLDLTGLIGCDAGPLPPGCDCICHTPYDFGRAENNYSPIEGSKYESDIAENEVYEIK